MTDQRAQDIAAQAKRYEWNYTTPDLPPFVDKVPSEEIVNADTLWHFGQMFADITKLTIKLNVNHVLDSVSDVLGRIFHRPEPAYQDYEDVFNKVINLPCPSIKDRWMHDEEFAWQRLNGMNPTLIRKVSDKHPLPANFKVAEDKNVQRLLESKGTTLDGLRKDGRLFICNYDIFVGIDCNDMAERCHQKPIALFYSLKAHNNRLMPLAIQPTQDDTCPIFTPLDPPGVWLSAKIMVQIADSSLHEVAAHLLATHYNMEAAYVAMRRTVHDLHPVSLFLKEHFWFTVALNDLARKKLVNETGAVPTLMSLGYEGTVKLIQKASREWHWKRYDIPHSIDRREINDTEADGKTKILPDFYWRDDALKLWDVIKRWVSNIVNTFYKTDSALADDVEIQNWVKLLVAPRTKGTDTGCGFIGIPLYNYKNNTVDLTLDKLILFLTGIIYNVSAGHATVNNGQFDYMGYLPNSPNQFRMPLDRLKPRVDISPNEIASKMPQQSDAVKAIVMVHVLSMPTDDLLGSYNSGFFSADTNPEVHQHLSLFLRDLLALSSKIANRNREIEQQARAIRTKQPTAWYPVKYTYMDPGQMAQGVSI